MLGLLLIYFAGKAFYDLADLNNKSKWGFAILGVISYYVGLALGAFGIGILMAYTDKTLDSTGEFVISLCAIPIGILTCWLFYKILENRWLNQATAEVDSSGDILDANLIDNQSQNLK
jgi:amino acid permease